MWSWLDLLQLLNGIGLLILAAIFTVGFNGEDSRSQLLSTFARVALLAAASWLYHRSEKVSSRVEASDEAQPRILVD